MDRKEIEVIFSAEFDKIAEELILILFLKDYFSFFEDADNYVQKIYAYVRGNITTYPAKNTPEFYKQYGENYLLYKANANTTWYIFFSQVKDVYFVQYITNNHTDFIENFNL